MKKFFLFLALFFAVPITAQVLPDGVYPIKSFSNYDGKKMLYHHDTSNDKSKVVVNINQHEVAIYMDSYLVDIISFDPRKTKRQLDGGVNFKGESMMDDMTRRCSITIVRDNLYELYMERGNGSYDIFEFTKPTETEPTLNQDN